MDPASFEAVLKIIGTLTVTGALAMALVLLFRRWWMPRWVHDEIVAQILQRLAKTEELLSSEQRDADRWRDAVLSSHGLAREAINLRTSAAPEHPL